MTLREALVQYVTIRRALGTKLAEPEGTLGQFVSFVEREQSSRITTALALRWAVTPQGVQRATWARRLSMVRKFATWLNAFDPSSMDHPHRGTLPTFVTTLGGSPGRKFNVGFPPAYTGANLQWLSRTLTKDQFWTE